MRTTVVIDSDVAAEIERLRHAGMGLSEALNLLARRGMTKDNPEAKAVKYQHRTSKVGLKVDVTNIADVLDLIDDDR
ncbi:MAG: CopG family transcriptional regulator [Mycobacterium sp.]|nr:CopG family transcriptional regulator [Mycobacterium sp.]